MKPIFFLYLFFLSLTSAASNEPKKDIPYDKLVYCEVENQDMPNLCMIANGSKIEIVDKTTGAPVVNLLLFINHQNNTDDLYRRIITHFEESLRANSMWQGGPYRIHEVQKNGYCDLIWSGYRNGLRIGNYAFVNMRAGFSYDVRLFLKPGDFPEPEKAGGLATDFIAKALLAYKPSSDEKKLREEIFKKRRIQEEQKKRQEEKERQQREEAEFLKRISEPRYGIPLNFWLLQHKKDGDKLSFLLKLPKGKTKVVGAKEKRQSLDEAWVTKRLLNGDLQNNHLEFNNGFIGRVDAKDSLNGSRIRIRKGWNEQQQEIHIIAQCFQTQQEAFDSMAAMRLIDVYHQDNVPVFEQIKVTLNPETTAKNTRINALKLGDINLTQTPLIDNSGLIDTRSVASAIWFVRNNTAVMVAARHPSVSVVDMARKIDKRIQEYDTAAEQRRNKKETN